VVPTNMDALEWLRKHLEEGGSDVLREMVKSFAEVLMSARRTRCVVPATASAARGGSGYKRQTCSPTYASGEKSRTGGRAAPSVATVNPEQPTDASLSDLPA
jgi:hypothetical protein